MELWNKIKQKTGYCVQIDTNKFVENCVEELKNLPPIPKAWLADMNRILVGLQFIMVISGLNNLQTAMEKIYTNLKMYNYCLLWFVINVSDDIMIKTEV